MPVTRSQTLKLKPTRNFPNEVEMSEKFISPLKSISLVNESSTPNTLSSNLQTPINNNSIISNDNISLRSEPLAIKKRSYSRLQDDDIEMLHQPLSLLPRIITSKFAIDTFGNRSSTTENQSNILIETQASFKLLHPVNLPSCKDRYFTSRSPPPLINSIEDSEFIMCTNTPAMSNQEVRVVSSVLLQSRNQNETYFEKGTGNSPRLIKQKDIGAFRNVTIMKNELDGSSIKKSILGSKSKTLLIEDNVTPLETTKAFALFEPSIVPKNLDSEGMFKKNTPLSSRRQRKNGITNREQVNVENFMRQISSPPLKDDNNKVEKTSLRLQLQPRTSSWSVDYCKDLEYSNCRKKAPTNTIRSCYFFGSPKPLSDQIIQTSVKDNNKNVQKRVRISSDLTPPNIIRKTSTEMGIPAINPNFLSSFEPIKSQGQQRLDLDGYSLQEYPENTGYNSSSLQCKRRNISPDNFDSMVDTFDGDIFCLDLLSTL